MKKIDSKIAMFTPGGQRWFDSYSSAIAAIKADFPGAIKIRRWHEGNLNFEDFKDEKGRVVAQLEMTGYPPMIEGFKYE